MSSSGLTSDKESDKGGEQTRDLGEFEEDFFSPNQDFENDSLVSSDEAKYRSIDVYRPLDIDMGGGFGFEGGLTKMGMPGDFAGLQEAFAQQRPDLMSQNKSSKAEGIFNIVETASTPQSLTKDMYYLVSKTMVFSKAHDINQVKLCIRDVVEEHDCFEGMADKDSHVEENEWILVLTHYSREKFSIDLNVTFWALEDMESVCSHFHSCPKDANFAVEFQRLGGDSFAWMDLWTDILASIERCNQPAMTFTSNARFAKRPLLNGDLLSDSEDDEGVDDVLSSLSVLMAVWDNSGIEGQLEALKALCRMSQNAGQCKQMSKNEAFTSFVSKISSDVHSECLKSSLATPLQRCVISLIGCLMSTDAGKTVFAFNEKVMGEVGQLLGDLTCCQAVRYECAKLVSCLATFGIDFAKKEFILSAVDLACSQQKNGKKLVDTLTQIKASLK